jgi:L-aspartate oxidase
MPEPGAPEPHALVHDVLILGGGVAGLSAAIQAGRAGCSVAVVTKTELGSSATQYAQGGVAAALDDEPDGDSPDLHLADTLSAGVALCDVDATRILVTEGPRRVRELIELGADFDRSTGDDLALAREGGHSVPRILHAGGDATGAEVERALGGAVQDAGTEVRARWFAQELIVEGGRARGVVVRDPAGTSHRMLARHTIIATGGAGQCFAVTTNPTLSTGDGIAMAGRAGVAVADVEFMQFHPTALHHPSMPRPLLSEALRGEGAVLRDEQGVAFMAGEHPLADLAPRDVVARAIARRLNERGLDHLWLDATTIPDFRHHFPTIWKACTGIGLDPSRDWLPVAPAAHYLSGGVCADLDGATTLPGLWACGEAACSGVHGANRLASNSLLDGLVFGARTVDAILRGKSEPDETGVLRGILGHGVVGSGGYVAPPDASRKAQGAFLDRTCVRDGDTAVDVHVRAELQQVMTREAGVLRSDESLGRAMSALAGMASLDEEVQNLLTVSRALVAAALARRESRGTHTRVDFPETDARLLGRFVQVGGAEPVFVPLPAPQLAGR